MRSPPEDLDAFELRAVLRDGWGFDAVSLAYQPVGFGSHHWLATAAGRRRLFATVDDLYAKLHTSGDSADAAYARLGAAFSTAYALRTQAGLGFVVAPLPDAHGQVIGRLSDRYALVVHPFVTGCVAGHDGEFRSAADLRIVVDLLVNLHGASSPQARADDFVVPARDELERLLADLTRRWDSGPYGDRARALLRAHADGVVRLLLGYDRLVVRVAARPDRMVVTHGEPHAGNILRTSAGMMLLDWESVLLAPPERDLWALSGRDSSVLGWYAAATGAEVDYAALSMYRLWYDLSEISGYLRLFRAPHGETADTAESWRNLRHFLRPAARWPDLTR